ncbi:DUF7158 domain-containing protein [Kitasatospora viridis]|uniref:[acyl-carrier-protein] S-malonyltransferase n=1 Tax=Kitasatospora viridis TaxID=281105 RepID=A0A561UA91_9ACTN|nr:hypothetical protein [Kitasatospora viridis]TWF96277.1 [acyl-carrier-protein] S-malonyltransferase [Kitasatospora viridis]
MTGLLGYLDGRALPRTELDARLAALRAGPRATALPAPGSPEDRQLTRWVAQVLLTQELCAAEAADRGLPLGAGGPVRLDQRAAVELGSITAAALEGSAAVRAVYRAVTAEVTVPAREPVPPEAGVRWRLDTPDGSFDADPATLPRALADALRTAPPGTPVTAAGWTATLVAELTPQPAAPPDDRLDCARRLAFARWLDRARSDRLTLVPGLEHPGDPAQPDNHHRH